MLHGTGIFFSLHLALVFVVNVGQYSSPMEHMGWILWPDDQFGIWSASFEWCVVNRSMIKFSHPLMEQTPASSFASKNKDTENFSNSRFSTWIDVPFCDKFEWSPKGHPTHSGLWEAPLGLWTVTACWRAALWCFLRMPCKRMVKGVRVLLWDVKMGYCTNSSGSTARLQAQGNIQVAWLAILQWRSVEPAAESRQEH